MNDIRLSIKTFFRDHLMGRENSEIKKEFMDKLGFSNENIKSYTNLNLVIIPPIEDLPKICEFFNVSLYELFGTDNPSNLSEIDRERLRKIKETPALADIIDNYSRK